MRDAECRARRKAPAALTTVDILKRPGGGGRGGGERGGVLPKRLKSGSGHHRLESFGPSDGRHKLAQGRPDFLAMLRSLPSGIDAFYAVFSQFLGSASMTFFLVSFPCFLFLSYPFLFFLAFLFFSCFSRLFFSFLPFSHSFLSFPFFSYLWFSFLCFFCPIDLRLTCVCVVIGTMCNIYGVVFPGWQAV